MNRILRRQRLVLSACLATLLVSINLSAQTTVTVNCCFDEVTGFVQSGAVVLGSPGDFWNSTQDTTSLAAGSVLDANSNIVSGVAVSISGGSYFASTSGTAYDASTLGLMEAYYTKSGGALTMSITGLAPFEGSSFTLVIYAAGNGAGQGDNLTITAGATGGNTGSTLVTTAASRKVSAGLGVAYNTFTGTINGGTLTITATANGDTTYDAFNGFQLQLTGAPSAAPFISTEPASISVFTNNNAVFHVAAASGSAVSSYQWAAGTTGSGGPYTNLSGSQYSGVNSSTLIVSNVMANNALDYVVTVANSSGPATSSPATLTVLNNNNNVLIDVSLGDGTANLQSGAAVLGQPGDDWNGLTYSSATIFNSSDTTLPGVVVLSSGWDGKEGKASGTAEDAATAALMGNYLFTVAPYTMTETVTGLAPYVGEYFEWVIYGAGNGADQGGIFNITTGASGGNTGASLADSGVTRQISLGVGNAYNVFYGTLTNGTLGLAAVSNTLTTPHTTYTALNGFQLQLFATPPPPFILSQPVSATANQNSSTNFSVVAGGPALSYQWYNNGAAITGQTNAVLVISPVETSNAATNYYVVVTNMSGAVTSAAASLTVETSPTITQEPSSTNLILVAGGNATLAIAAAGAAPLVYQWYGNSTAIAGATNSTYTLHNVHAGPSTNYYCEVTNFVGSTNSSIVSVSVVTTTDPFLMASYVQTVLSNSPIGFWPLNEVPDNSSGDNGTTAYDYIGGNNGYYTNAVLGFTGYAEGLAAEYGYSPATDTNSSAEFGSYATTASYVAQIPNVNFSTPTGSNAEFSVEAWVAFAFSTGGGIVAKGYGGGGEEFCIDTGAGGNAFRFFVRNFVGTSYAASSTIVPQVNNPPDAWYHLVGVCDEANGRVLLYVNGLLAASNAIPSLSGIVSDDSWPMTIGARAISASSNYTSAVQCYAAINDVAVFNYAMTSNQVAAEYLAAGIPAQIIQEPMAGTNILIGATLVVPTEVQGTAPLFCQWFDNNTGQPLHNATNAALVISNVASSDSYYLQVSNAYGTNTSSQVSVTVDSSPQPNQPITPAAAVVVAGSSITFSASFYGVSPFTYGWQLNGNPIFNSGRISGANSSSLTVKDIQLSDAGNYQLLVTNADGNNQTGQATLTVLPNLQFDGGAGWTSQGTSLSWPSASLLQLTDSAGHESNSSFGITPVYVGAFQASFTYQVINPSGTLADGSTFCIQNDPRGAAAIGTGGGDFGYGPATSPGITPSVAFEINLYASDGLGVAFGKNGSIGPNSSTIPLVFDTGDVITNYVSYNGETMTVMMTDAAAGTSFVTNWAVNIPAVLGTNTAYVGFTAGDGEDASTQQVGNFQFISYVPLTVQASGGSVTITWPTAVGAYVLQENSNLSTGNWVNDTNAVSVAGNQNQVTERMSNTSLYYRLALPVPPL